MKNLSKQIKVNVAENLLTNGTHLPLNVKKAISTANKEIKQDLAATSHPRILLVTDNVEGREYINCLLSQNYYVQTVADGLAALAIVGQQLPDLILTDVTMSGISVWQLLNELRSNPHTREVPIILIFSRGAEKSEVEDLEFGADDYLFQPFSYNELLARVGTHLKMARMRREAIQREKTAQAEVEDASQRLINVLESITDGFYAFDHQWRFTYVNKAAEDLMEMTRSQLIGRSFWEVYPQAIGTLFDQEVHRAVLEQVAVHFDAPSADSDRWHEVHAYPSQDGLSVYWREITERKKAEEKIRQTNQTLEALVRNEQSARKEAETANRIKDEFLATLSHELRSPLSSILGWAELLRTRKFDETIIARALETIERNAKSQTQLIDDLLDVSRIIQGKMRLNVRPINLVSVVETAINTLRPAADAKAIEIKSTVFDLMLGQVEQSFPSDDCSSDQKLKVQNSKFLVLGDPDRLQQIIWNLLSNALKFTPQSGRVEVQLHFDTTHAQIIISDTGKGINKDFLPHVFERFRQADSSITRSYGGLGLGLAIVRHLVELHGGTVQADSEGEGKGATFTIKLPVNNSEIAENYSQPAVAIEKQKTRQSKYPDLKGLRVVVVDDEKDTRDFLTVTLQQCGAEISSAGSVQQAIATIKEVKPDILVSDIGMPGEDGYALIREIKTWASTQGLDIQAIALTAYARDRDRKKALAAGFQVHISKPVQPIELAGAIANLVGRNAK